MSRRALLLGLLTALVLATGACWPWEDSSAPPPEVPTPTPPKVEEAGQSSPSIEGRLLYARDGSIWLRTGTTARRLTEGILATQPAWSPDGTYIAFVVEGEGYSDLWVMAADGSNPHPITNSRPETTPGTSAFVYSALWAFQPQWMPPDGTWLSYISHFPPQARTSTMSIWIVRPDGSERQRYLPMQAVESPTWSPDGHMLAFTHFIEDGAQLRYYDVDTDAVLRLGEDVAGVERYDPAWSPDGLWIAYAARQAGRTDLWAMPSPQNPLYEGEWSPVRLTDLGAARGPAWSPAGKQIAFIAAKGDSFDLWLLDLKIEPGQAPQPAGVEQLTTNANVDATARPSWAP
jgi:TolB protein